MIRIQNSGVVAALAVTIVFAAAIAQAEMMKFTTELTGTAEVPPTDSTATGTAEVTLDTEAKKGDLGLYPRRFERRHDRVAYSWPRNRD